MRIYSRVYLEQKRKRNEQNRCDSNETTLRIQRQESTVQATAKSLPDAIPSSCDVLVVGGGINGAGIARDLAGRGLKVVLCEKDDLAQATSSSSTKLIHGGLRYLEYNEFSLVRKALAEREVLLRSAPHIMWPLRFVMPHDPGMRPVWMIRIGLFLYDHLARREVLPPSRTVDLRRHPAGAPLQPRFTKGFVYSDGWVDDARLVVLNAIDATERGATVLTRWHCRDAQRAADGWQITLDHRDGSFHTLRARALVNAAGPWAAQFLSEHAHLSHPKALRLVKGSHIVVPKLFEHGHAYIFQNPDKRIIFAIPYEHDFTLIGTTDVEHHGEIGGARIDESEIRYLCEQASRYFAKPVTPQDVVWTYSGVRPLLDDESGDPSAVTRDYSLELDTAQAPLLTVWGGKITTFRRLAQDAADLLMAPLQVDGRRGAWTHGAFLPGGDLSPWIGAASRRPDADFARFEQAARLRFPQLAAPVLHRLARAYGARIDRVIGDAASPGAEVAPGLFEFELHYLHDHEWARSAEDVLWRRSKLGLHYTAEERAAVATWCAANWASDTAWPRRAEPWKDLQDAWQSTWRRLGLKAPQDDLLARLVARWAEPHRKYHTLQHLRECLALFEGDHALAAYPGEVAIALWFHDAIYDTSRHDNEALSAAWACQVLLQAGASAEAIERVHALIMATRHSQVPATADEQLLVDIDLAILGAAPARFDDYERQIRAEYGFVPEAVFRARRGEILRGFLARPALFSTPTYVARFESVARANLAEAITALA